MSNRREMAELLKLAWPATFSSLCFALMEVVDTAMLGLVGIGSMAGAALASTVLLLIVALPNNFLRAIAPIAAATGGEATKRDHIRSLSRMVASVGFILGSIAALVVIGAAFLLPFFGYEPELVMSARTYLIWRAPFLPMEVIFLGGWSLLDGLGKQRLTLLTGVVSNIANVIFNLLLIPGLWGLPALGVMGAAISTDISVLFGLLVIGVYLFKKGRTRGRFSSKAAASVRQSYREPVPAHRIFGWLVGLGWPLGLSGLIEVFGGVAIGLLIARFGQDTMAVHGLVSRLIGLGLPCASGIGVATITLVARAVGHHTNIGVRQNIKVSLGVQLGTQTAIGILMFIGVDVWGAWLSSDSTILGRVTTLMPLWLVILWTEGLIVVLTSVLEGMGRTRRLLWATIVDLGLLLPGAIALSPEYGLTGFYLAWLIKNVIKILILLRYKEGSKEIIMSDARSGENNIKVRRLPQYPQSTGILAPVSKQFVMRAQREFQKQRSSVFRFWPLPIPDG